MWQTMNFKFEVQTFPSEDLHQWNTEYRIAGSFRGRKVLQTSHSFVAIIFLHEIWRHGVLSSGKSEQPQKFSPRKSYFFTNLRKFSPSKVSHYTVILLDCGMMIM